MKIETVRYKKQIIAKIFHKSIKADGVRFLTPQSYTLQLGLLEHSAGKIIKEHIHRQDIKYKVDTTQEFLYIEKGKVLVQLFNKKWKLLKDVILTSGDFILFINGGHGLKVMKDCRIIEIKQGPYPGEKRAKIYRNN